MAYDTRYPVEMEAEGWYKDPYKLHEARWYSVGSPTALVRDAGVESHDVPPVGPPLQLDEPVEEPDRAVNGSDLRRADKASEAYDGFDSRETMRAVIEGSGELGIGFY